eukprot:3275920-Prymnesium_polylepis.2
MQRLISPRASRLVRQVQDIEEAKGDDDEGLAIFKPSRAKRNHGPPVVFGKPHNLEPEVRQHPCPALTRRSRARAPACAPACAHLFLPTSSDTAVER